MCVYSSLPRGGFDKKSSSRKFYNERNRKIRQENEKINEIVLRKLWILYNKKTRRVKCSELNFVKPTARLH